MACADEPEGLFTRPLSVSEPPAPLHLEGSNDDIYDIGDSLEDFDLGSDYMVSDGELTYDDDAESETYASEPEEPLGEVTSLGPPPTNLSLTVEALHIRRLDLIGRLAKELVITESVASLLLQASKWSIEDARHLDPVHPSTWGHGKLEGIQSSHKTHKLSKRMLMRWNCAICRTTSAEQLDGAEVAGLSCGHDVCFSCFTEYLEHKISERALFPIKCPGGHRCAAVVTPESVKELVRSDFYRRYEDGLTAQFIENTKSIRGCPAAGCRLYVEKKFLTTAQHSDPVRCACGYSFCFSCLEPPHAPASCALVKDWRSRLEHDDLTSMWVTKNTRSCSRCASNIERTEGCNHMVCTKCQNEFCWVCNGSWESHRGSNYICAKMPTITGPTSSLKNLEKRFWHYSPRYSTHVIGQKYHAKAVSSLNGSQVVTGAGSQNRKLLAHQGLHDARGILAWSYVHLYYAVNSNQKVIVENIVNDLERVVEELSQLLSEYDSSGGIPTGPCAELTAYVQQRSMALASAVLNSKWAFEKALLCAP